jgi:transcriptional regulator with XRE-family HTH domain
MTATSFANMLTRIRTAKGVSQTRLAHRAGYDRSYVSRLERATRRPTIDAVDNLALGLDADEVEHDALRLSAGFAPATTLLVGEVVVRDLNDLLADESVNVADRDSVRDMVTILVQSARRRNAPRYETYGVATVSR